MPSLNQYPPALREFIQREIADPLAKEFFLAKDPYEARRKKEIWENIRGKAVVAQTLARANALMKKDV